MMMIMMVPRGACTHNPFTYTHIHTTHTHTHIYIFIYKKYTHTYTHSRTDRAWSVFSFANTTRCIDCTERRGGGGAGGGRVHVEDGRISYICASCFLTAFGLLSIDPSVGLLICLLCVSTLCVHSFSHLKQTNLPHASYPRMLLRGLPRTPPSRRSSVLPLPIASLSTLHSPPAPLRTCRSLRSLICCISSFNAWRSALPAVFFLCFSSAHCSLRAVTCAFVCVCVGRGC